MRKILSIFFLALAIQSCSTPDTLQEVNVENRYTITIPSFLTETQELNDEASLQYLNGAREFYVVVIDESKEEFHQAIINNLIDQTYSPDLTGYANLLLDNFSAAANVKSKTKITESTINNMPALGINISAAFDGVDVFCSMTYLEGKTNYYQVFAWTLKENEKDYKASINEIAKTLKEI
jgi:hypothetical protein